MTVLRREDVQSTHASWDEWDECPYRTVGPPILTIVPGIIYRLRDPTVTRRATSPSVRVPPITVPARVGVAVQPK